MSFDGAPFGSVPFGGILTGAVDPSKPSPVQALLSGDIDPIQHLIIVKPYNLATSSRVPLYLSDGWASRPGATLPTGESLANQLFVEILDTPPNREVHCLSGGAINESATPSYGDVGITDAYMEFIPTWEAYSWEGAPLTHYQGDPSWDLSSFATTFQGNVSRFAANSSGGVSLQVYDLLQRLQRPVENTAYLGFGACLKGDGVDDRVNFGNVLNQTGSFSVRFRIWPNSNVNDLSRTWNKDDGTAGGWSHGINNQNLRFFIRTASTSILQETVGAPLSAGVWNDCWISLDTVTQKLAFRVCRDGVDAIAEEIYTFTGVPVSNSVALTFGARSDGIYPFSGRWDELAIFNRSLSLSDVKSYREKELFGDEPGLVGLWHCNEATGTTIYDSVSTNNGTLSSPVWAGSLTGTAAVKGKRRIGAAGYVLELEPVVLDEVDLVYEVAFKGMVGVVQDSAGYMLKDKGIRPFVYDGNYADPYSYNPPVGHWISINAMGLIRLGSKPAGRLTVTAQVTPATDAGSIIALLATRAGLSPQEVDAGALAILTARNPAPLSIPWGLEPSTIDSLIVTAAASVGAWRTTNLSGSLTAAIFDLPAATPVVDLTADDVVVDGIETLDSSSAAVSVEVRYRRYLSTQSATDLSATLSQREAQDLGLEVRSFKTPDNAAAVAANAAAPSIVRDVAMIYERDARTEAAREQTLRSVPRRTDRVPLVRPRHDLQPGMTVRITAPVKDYGGGKLVQVVGKIVDDGNQAHSLEVWG